MTTPNLRDDAELVAEVASILRALEDSADPYEADADRILDAIDRRTTTAPPEPTCDHTGPGARICDAGSKWRCPDCGAHVDGPGSARAATPGTAPTPPSEPKT